MWPCDLLWSRKNSASVHQDLNFGYIMERQRQLLSAWIPKWGWHESEVMSTCNAGIKHKDETIKNFRVTTADHSATQNLPFLPLSHLHSAPWCPFKLLCSAFTYLPFWCAPYPEGCPLFLDPALQEHSDPFLGDDCWINSVLRLSLRACWRLERPHLLPALTGQLCSHQQYVSFVSWHPLSKATLQLSLIREGELFLMLLWI